MCVSLPSNNLTKVLTWPFGKQLLRQEPQLAAAAPQTPKQPDSNPLTRQRLGGPVTLPQGSTLLTGESGIASNSLLLGSTSFLGGGKGG